MQFDKNSLIEHKNVHKLDKILLATLNQTHVF